MRLQLQKGALCVAVMAMAACSASSGDAGDVRVSKRSTTDQPQVYRLALERARAQRLAQVRAPDGWLSYTGSGRLRAGQYRVGSDPHNDLVLPAGPGQLGQLSLDVRGHVRFKAAAGAAVRLNGQPVDEVSLEPERADQRGDRLDVGNRQFYLVQTGTLFGWRFRDPVAPALIAFQGFEYFPIDPQWRVDARWHPYAAPRSVTLLTSIGTPLTAEVPGEAVFTRDGHEYHLQPIAQHDGSGLFFLFTDRTSGKESYGGARYLFTAMPRDGHVLLDFNLAENPPCAFTPHVVCPIAPPENRLAVAVNAGEKTYRAVDP
ncbi:DUF1684 domain-containing protein [Xanthomonas vesicatoria]|uniref:DUF1684 domain-containing protein n=2 Tax=Xanthomonas vesicatoria TaxID=56460 RepID=A0AAJ0N432_9XANT|nr:DUF1684 domain-containing protein [Xanthomonas vesicatoria]APO97137.1 hypothetical protein BI313_01680 [Xanthomonas vesicatoria]APP78055.1 hypothetical protein BJD12_21285 [Xanthomonas vesicatoria ATCC 35937]EGD07547.1 hypothetical protein XVE_4268 [Xanthomonas vesicatoria ATCC 35937]KHM92962.1 lipoprotein [Xanthomonas vesicatoria]KHM97102.1 lipoprotein [Xanthomonas vesicatoria]